MAPYCLLKKISQCPGLSLLRILQFSHSLPSKPSLSAGPCPSGQWDNSPFLPQTCTFSSLCSFPGQCFLRNWSLPSAPCHLSPTSLSQYSLAEGGHRSPSHTHTPAGGSTGDLWKQIGFQPRHCRHLQGQGVLLHMVTSSLGSSAEKKVACGPFCRLVENKTSPLTLFAGSLTLPP